MRIYRIITVLIFSLISLPSFAQRISKAEIAFLNDPPTALAGFSERVEKLDSKIKAASEARLHRVDLDCSPESEGFIHKKALFYLAYDQKTIKKVMKFNDILAYEISAWGGAEVIKWIKLYRFPFYEKVKGSQYKKGRSYYKVVLGVKNDDMPYGAQKIVIPLRSEIESKADFVGVRNVQNGTMSWGSLAADNMNIDYRMFTKEEAEKYINE
ncbi:hypothetical protein Dip518_000237 [Parelusimicrobium proximum]|uniref:hypothetical protein n=1 Tax=Parelusimicrobium proximum TaxID=3228953 RepID=UPI003D186187